MQQGFTLTDCMVAIGVVAALAISGMSFYDTSKAKAQVQEGLDLAMTLKDSINTYYESHDPAELPEAGFNDYGADPTPYVSSAVSDASGKITVTFSSRTQGAVSGRIIELIPTQDGGHHLSWSCQTNINGGRLDGNTQHDGEVSILVPYHCIINTQ